MCSFFVHVDWQEYSSIINTHFAWSFRKKTGALGNHYLTDIACCEKLRISISLLHSNKNTYYLSIYSVNLSSLRHMTEHS